VSPVSAIQLFDRLKCFNLLVQHKYIYIITMFFRVGLVKLL
jgi:hypothetical protein